MASKVDARLLKSTKFPPEFSKKVDMQKVNLQVMKKWIANGISDILGNEDDVVIELCFNLIEGSRHPDIKSLQIQLTGFLDKDTAPFCKKLWNLLLSAQGSPQGVPKELLEAKKLELMQEKTSSNEIGMTEQTTMLILGRDDLATIPLTTVPDEGIRIAQEDPVGRRNPKLEVHGNRMAGIVTYRMLGVVVTTNEDGDAIVLLPKTNPLDRGRGIALHLAKARHPKALHVEDPPHQGIVVLERGRGHLVEMPTVRDMNDVITETTVLGLLVVPDLYLPAAARQRIKKEGGQSHAADHLPAADGSHHHLPQARAVDQGHVVVAEGHPQEERTNVAAVMSLVAPTGHEIGEAEIAEGLVTRVNGPQDEDEIALLNHLPNLGVVNQLKPWKTNVPPRRRILLRMADNKNGSAAGPLPTLAEYKKSQARVRELVEKRRALDKRLNQVEESIMTKEASYLESTPSGNIITGFDNYMKGTSSAAAQRRKAGPADQNRVFSKSSISYRPNNGDSTPGSTPASHAAPTPVSASFRDNGTPSSGTGNKSKSKKKAAAVADKEVEDSENDGATGKKRTNFGASRK
ncbi:hypothetical protein EsDP_00000617 [Epichloe bromicola]|uniref:Chromatin modification-related protein EAF6 n=1 Tax=Epichloe bromicola TaxID=79588 RepID=A0ABQ0CFG4_9HYPO